MDKQMLLKIQEQNEIAGNPLKQWIDSNLCPKCGGEPVTMSPLGCECKECGHKYKTADKP